MVRSSLEMCNVRSLASGEYACVADNTLTSSSTSFKVTIDGEGVVSCGCQSKFSSQLSRKQTLHVSMYNLQFPKILYHIVGVFVGGDFHAKSVTGNTSYVYCIILLRSLCNLQTLFLVCKAQI